MGIDESVETEVMPSPTGTQTATYNARNQQLTNLPGQALTWDAVGNLTLDGQRSYAWDAENRLIGITYPGISGKATAFTYDGLSRRRTIASTPPGGGSATTTSYLWCGDDICQARNATNATLRSYYDEGEYLPGTPAQTLYYGIDQIGSVRRVFASTSSAPAYGYDPYGLALQTTAPLTDFVYGGMFYNADSGLYLTRYRVYDPIAGRWLSRDPVGERTDPTSNLYVYVGGNPPNLTDALGLAPSPVPSMPSPFNDPSCSGDNFGFGSNWAFYNPMDMMDDPVMGWRPCLMAGPGGCGGPGGGGGGGGGGKGGGAKSPKNFQPPTNPPSQPPSIPSDWTAKPLPGGGTQYFPPGADTAKNSNSIRVMPPTNEYPNGYWRQYNQNNQPINPGNRGRTGTESETHIPIPPI